MVDILILILFFYRMEKEIHDTKYFRDLLEYWNAYMHAVINEIYAGTGISLGLSEKRAYALIKNKPSSMQKAGFFKNIFDRFKGIFKYKISKFRPSKNVFGNGKTMTPQQWDIFNKEIDAYWKKHADAVTEDISTKSYLLGKQTTDFRRKKKPYQNKSLFQIDFDQYDGNMPKKISDAYKKYDFTNSEKQIVQNAFSSIAMHVTQTNDEIRNAIRQHIQQGLNDGKSHTEIASDLYWNVQKDEKLTNKYTAETLRRNWNRVSQTEMAYVYEAGILAPYESQAMESMKDSGRAVYFVFTGGTCPWCRAHHGTITRMVPMSVVTDSSNDSLESMGIKDPNTDIAIWIGKNNVGYRETKSVHGWRVCTPAHPYNVATMQPIDLQSEFYNNKTGRIEQRQTKQKFVPQQLDYSKRGMTQEEKDFRKPTYIGKDLVRYNNNVYERVQPDEYNRKKAAWDKNNSLPIPVATDSTRYAKIFGEQ